jgi:uncharacterized protein
MSDLYGRVLDEQTLAKAQMDYMSKVYSWMVGGLLVTALTAMFAVKYEWDAYLIHSSLFYILIFAEFGLVLALSGWVNKMSKSTAMISFLGYSFLNGLTFSVIISAYTSESIYNTFFIAAGMFGALSLWGYVTKKDLGGVGRFMFMGLVGIIIASIMQFFFVSSALNFVISVAGVIIFSGLTAYDTQRIKEMYVVLDSGDEVATKGAIMGALMLYLDFINLFLFLLRFFG